MISGIESFNIQLQKAILGCIASLFDLSSDIKIKELEDNVIQIDDTKYYVITDDDIRRKIASHNSEAFDAFFSNLNSEQLRYVNEDLWEEEEGITSFEEWLNYHTDYSVKDNDYYGKYNFYEIR